MFKNIQILLLCLSIVCVNVASAQNNTQEPSQSQTEKPSIDPDFQKMMEESKKNEVVQNSLKNELVEKTVEEPKIKSEVNNAVKMRPKTNTEIALLSTIGILFLIINFIGSAFLPKFRYLFIGSPFDLGVRETKTDAQNAVKGKRIKIELILLVLIIIFYSYFSSGNKPVESDGIVDVITESLILVAVAYVFYVAVRLWVGYSSRCPSCKNMFAGVCTNRHQEPRSTYQKRSNTSTGTDGKGVRLVDVTTVEVGIEHSDHICKVCDHTWHVAKEYKKNIGTHKDTY